MGRYFNGSYGNRVGTQNKVQCWALCELSNEPSVSIKGGEISWLAEGLSMSQEGFCSMELTYVLQKIEYELLCYKVLKSCPATCSDVDNVGGWLFYLGCLKFIFLQNG